MPFTFIYKECAFCNGNGRATVTKYWPHSPNHTVSYQIMSYSVQRSLREAGYRYGGFCMVMVFTPTTSKKYNFCQEM